MKRVTSCSGRPHVPSCIAAQALSTRTRRTPACTIPTRLECEKVRGIDRDRAVARAPVEGRARHAPGPPHESDLLAAGHRIPHGHERLAHMEIAGHDAATVIDVHDVPGEKEFRDERDDAAVRGPNGLARLPRVVDPEVAAGHAAVEHAPGARSEEHTSELQSRFGT